MKTPSIVCAPATTSEPPPPMIITGLPLSGCGAT
jgi:hypothetical protein